VESLSLAALWLSLGCSALATIAAWSTVARQPLPLWRAAVATGTSGGWNGPHLAPQLRTGASPWTLACPGCCRGPSWGHSWFRSRHAPSRRATHHSRTSGNSPWRLLPRFRLPTWVRAEARWGRGPCDSPARAALARSCGGAAFKHRTALAVSSQRKHSRCTRCRHGDRIRGSHRLVRRRPSPAFAELEPSTGPPSRCPGVR